ncbi:MAG: ATP-binding protein [Bacteroidales bacterium]|nr:ATP-binding protein [Bacteroidales bacterium]
MNIQRSCFQKIIERILEPRKFIQVLYGARQVGKTTLMQQVAKAVGEPYLFASADDMNEADTVWVRRLWDEARKLHRQTGKAVLLIIDEIQKVPNWSESVKKEWDADSLNSQDIKVVILGSSSLKIQQGLTESLAGRFESIFIPHWSYQEMADAFGFSLNQYIWLGGYPGSAQLVSDEKRWKHYIRNSLIDTTLSRDILMMTRVDKPVLLRRLFEIGCSYSAQILSLTKIQGELMESGNLTTLSHYLSLLSSASLLCGLEKFSNNVLRKRASKPKFQVFNNALMSAVSPYSWEEAALNPSLWGRAVESAVGTHLLNHSYGEDYRLYYWNENSKEVDFVIENGKKTVAIEVKSGKDSFNRGMALFDQQFHPSALYTIGTDGIPLEEFFRMNPAELF